MKPDPGPDYAAMVDARLAELRHTRRPIIPLSTAGWWIVVSVGIWVAVVVACSL